MADGQRVALPLIRGTDQGADCPSCPFSRDGEPNKPVYAEGPEDPSWIVIGEGPGMFEVRQQRPFIGPSGQVVNKMLAKIGRPRDQIWVTNATLCIPPQGAPDTDRQLAASACSARLKAELAQFPGKPVLTLGAVAARAVIPQAALDAIDPPDTPKAIRKAQKLRQQPELQSQTARRKAISKEGQRRLKKLIAHQRKMVIAEIKAKHRKRPDERYLEQEVNRVRAKLELKAREDAIKFVDLKIKERALKKLINAAKPKPRKPKKIKITDICGSLFDVDVDGTGVRPLIPAIHPAALLRGGGASIGGSHTPDMAYVNLCADALKVDALAQGKDIRLKLNVAYELTDQERAAKLFLAVYRDALAEGAFSLDLETYVDDPERHHALMAYVAQIKVIGLATKSMTVSLAWELLPTWCFSLLQLLFGQAQSTFHNGLYDRTVLRARGFIIPDVVAEPDLARLYEDTLYLHHAAFPGNSHRLQTVTAQFYGVKPWKSEYRNQEETADSLAQYNAQDTGATHALRAPLHVWIKRRHTEPVYELDKKMADMASRMHLAGMPIDRDINNELMQTFSKNVIESRKAVEDTARDPKLREQIWHHLAIQQAGKKRKLDPDDFEARYQIRLDAMRLDPDWRWKIGAGKHIAALLLAMGVGLYQTTATGQISTQKDVLENLVGVPIVRDILSYRENDKLYSTFVYPAFDRCDPMGNVLVYGFADDNGFIHPIWNVHRISGRWASQWPVVSNVPKDKWKRFTPEEMEAIALLVSALALELPTPGKGMLTLPDGRLIRVGKDNSISKMVRPNLRRQIKAKLGFKLVGFDFGQIEARVIALISGDPFLCAIFAEGRDPHIECARIIWPGFDKLDPDTRKQLRENVKNIEYGFMYMAQLETLHATMLKAGNMIRLEDLAKAINKLAEAMAVLKQWQMATIARASMPPFEIRDFVLGRLRSWPMGQVEGTEAVNFGVQTAAAGIMNQGMARMAPKLLEYQECDPIAQIHDASVFHCREDDVERLSQDIKGSFETEIERDGRRIPFPVDVKVGDSWDQV